MTPGKRLATALALALAASFAAAGPGGATSPRSQAPLFVNVMASPYKAACDGQRNDTASFRAAASALATTGGVIFVPPARGCLISGLVLPADEALEGAGPGASHLLNAARSGNMLTLGGSNDAVRDLDLNAAYSGTPTSGAAIAEGDFSDLYLTDLTIEGAFDGILANGNSPDIDQVEINQQVAGGDAITVGALTTHAGTVDARITRTTCGGAHRTPYHACLLVKDAGGLFLSDDDFLFADYGTELDPGPDQAVAWAFISNSAVGDTDAIDGFYATTQAKTGIIEGISLANAWAGSAAAAGVLVDDAGGGVIAGLHFNGFRAFNNAAGFKIAAPAAHDVTLEDVTVCGATRATADFEAAAGVGDFSIQNSRLIAGCDGLGGTRPLASIEFDGQNANVMITDNNLTGTAAALLGPPPIGASMITDNLGVLAKRK